MFRVNIRQVFSCEWESYILLKEVIVNEKEHDVLSLLVHFTCTHSDKLYQWIHNDRFDIDNKSDNSNNESDYNQGQ